MSTELAFFGEDEEPEDGTEQVIPAVEEPYDLRPDLSSLGIVEIERGVCEDTYENRAALRRAHLRYQAVYDTSGRATGLISATPPQSEIDRRIMSLGQKRPILTDPEDLNSDYLTGVDLILTPAAHEICPPWVIGSTRAYLAEQEAGGPPSAKRQPKGLPHRCRMVKSDNIRCMLWGSGRVKDDGLCRIHLKAVRKPGEDIERARELVQAAPFAVDVLEEELMESATSEPVRLKASTEILDRAGVRGGSDLMVDVVVEDRRDPAEIIKEKLERLAAGAAAVQARLDPPAEDEEIIDAEVVSEIDPDELKRAVEGQ